MPSERILLVDDDQLITRQLTDALEAEGYAVVSYNDPFKAAEEKDFSIVVTDYHMPGMTGVELLDIFKQTRPEAIRIVLTSATDFKVALLAVNRGEIFRLLHKPWSYDELITCIRQAGETYRLRQENERLHAELNVRNAQLLNLNSDLERRIIERTNGLLRGLVAALDSRDSDTQWHSQRVALFARRVAEEVGIKGEELEVIEQGSMLHDIGKIGVKDSILLKPGPLSPEEWVDMKLHPDIGFRMLAGIPYLRDAAQIVLQHQERWDGKGYPQGLAGEAICIGARIFSIIDAMDAITSDRPYRQGSSIEFARGEITRCAGTQFDPHLVETYLSIPQSEWERIRQQVADLEREEISKWGQPASRTTYRQSARV